jgi:dipeptidase E
MRLLLLSNSTNHGGGYLDHASADILELFAGVRRILFVPFALHDQEGYWQRARDRFAAFGIEAARLEEGPTAPGAVDAAAGVFVGGGNTFRLLDRLQRCGALEAIRRRARSGIPYMGASAGTVIASPTLRTTNDMPIVQPASFDALGLVPFQINCHYLDADPASTHMGETREQRIREFHEENTAIVVGLREGGILRIDEDAAERVVLKGTAGARIFRRGQEPVELQPGTSLDHLLPA